MEKIWGFKERQAVYVLLKFGFSWMENLMDFINLLTHLKPIFQSRADQLEDA